jgi:hypothetical protein
MKHLEELDSSGGQKVTLLERNLVALFKVQAMQGALEHSQNQIHKLMIGSNTIKPEIPSRSQIVAALERLVLRNILRKRTTDDRKSTPSLYALRIFVEVARESWGQSNAGG